MERYSGTSGSSYNAGTTSYARNLGPPVTSSSSARLNSANLSAMTSPLGPPSSVSGLGRPVSASGPSSVMSSPLGQPAASTSASIRHFSGSSSTSMTSPSSITPQRTSPPPSSSGIDVTESSRMPSTRTFTSTAVASTARPREGSPSETLVTTASIRRALTGGGSSVSSSDNKLRSVGEPGISPAKQQSEYERVSGMESTRFRSDVTSKYISPHRGTRLASVNESEARADASHTPNDQPTRESAGSDAASRWLNSADVLLVPKSSANSQGRLYKLDDTHGAATPGSSSAPLGKLETSSSTAAESSKRVLKQTIQDMETDDDEEYGEEDRLPRTRQPSTLPSSSSNLSKDLYRTPGPVSASGAAFPRSSSLVTATSRLSEPPSSSTVTSSVIPNSKTSIFDEDPNLDNGESVSLTAAERKAERFLNVAGTVLTENKILEQDPRALLSSGCRVLLRSFRGTYLRKTRESNRAMTGGTPFDLASCEFVLDKHSSVPSKVLMYGDSVFLRLATGTVPQTEGYFLSGTDFTRDSRATWTIRRFIGSSSSTGSTKPTNSSDSFGGIDYVRSSDAIVLEYDSNQRVLGAPSVPHDAEGSAYATLEISPLESSQSWNLVRVMGLATSFVPSSALSTRSHTTKQEEEANGLLGNAKETSIEAPVYLVETLMGLYTPSASLERLIKNEEDLLLLGRSESIMKHVAFLREYVRTHKEMEWGRVVHALCFHLEEKVLDAFDEFLASELLSSSTKVHSMTYVVNAIQPRCRIVSDWARALEQVQFMRGGMLLNALNGLKLGAFEQRSSCEEALSCAMQPYLESLRKWIVFGEVFDPFNEFLIVENVRLTQQQLATDYNAKYWNSKFSLREEKHIPWFLRKRAESILKTGRDLQAVKIASLSSSTLTQSSSSTSLTMLSKAFAQPAVAFIRQPQLGEGLLVECHKRASAQLLKVLIDSKLFRRLDLVKKFFLLERGDFFLYFMDVAGEELRKPAASGGGGSTKTMTTTGRRIVPKTVGENQQHRLETLLQVAMREREISQSSGEHGGEDVVVNEFLNDLGCVLLPYAVDTHVETIHRRAVMPTPPQGGLESSNNEEALEGEIVGLDDVLLCVDALALDVSPSWPVSLVLTKRVMTKYQLLFRHLFRCKHAERRICASWLATRRLGQDDTVAQNLILRMMHFLQSLEYYMAFEVVEPRWRDFIAKAKSAKEIDELLRAHEDFLDSCLRECLLTNPSLIRGLSRLLRLSLSLGDLLLPEAGDDHGGRIPVRCDPIRVSEFDRELSDFLLSLYQEAEKGQFRTEHLHNLAIRLDFSGFYGIVG